MVGLGALSILALTVTLSLSRPKIWQFRIHHAAAATIGALLTLLFVIPLPLAFVALKILFYPVITIISLMVITLIAEQAGLFQILAWQIARLAKGNGRRLFSYLFFAGTLTGSIFTNDAAVLIFTPLVYNLIEDFKEKSWSLTNKIPFYFAVLYVANLVGAFVISNPINIIVSSIFDIRFLEYAKWMVLPAFISIITSYFGLLYYFRKSIPKSFTIEKNTSSRPKNRRFMLLCGITLLLTLVGFFTENLTGVSTWLIALIAALILTVVHQAVGKTGMLPIVRGVGWDVIVFVIGIFIVAYGLRHAGLTHQIGKLIDRLTEPTVFQLTTVTGFVSAICSSIMNNHPTANIMAMIIDDMGISGYEMKMVVFSALIGGDLGPKMLPIGSLAALLWFRILRNKGVHIPYSLYIKIGIPVTLAAILFSILTLNLEYLLFKYFLS